MGEFKTSIEDIIGGVVTGYNRGRKDDSKNDLKHFRFEYNRNRIID